MELFGPYEVLEQVAAGSTGIVYRARHVEIGRLVAVKQLHPELTAVPGLLDRFRGEARILAQLDDPHVVTVYDFVEEADRVWIAEEWVTGATLQSILSLHGRLTVEQSLGVLRGALQGLAYAHDRGVVHRDVATGNVVADMAGTSKLLDFGLAAPVGGSDARGTPAFISPEAARGEPVGKQGDVYSAAAVLYLLLSGQPPFPAADAATVLRRHQQDPAPALTGHGRELASVVGRALAKDPAERPADAAALLAELEDAAERKYGAAWVGASALAGIVGAVVRSGGGTGGVLGSGGVSAASSSAIIDTAIIDTGSRPTNVPPRSPTPAPTPGPAPVLRPPVPEPAPEPAPPPRRTRPRVPKVPALVGVAVVLAVAGTATAVTLSGSTPTASRTSTASSTPSSPTGGGPSGGTPGTYEGTLHVHDPVGAFPDADTAARLTVTCPTSCVLSDLGDYFTAPLPLQPLGGGRFTFSDPGIDPCGKPDGSAAQFPVYGTLAIEGAAMTLDSTVRDYIRAGRTCPNLAPPYEVTFRGVVVDPGTTTS